VHVVRAIAAAWGCVCVERRQLWQRRKGSAMGAAVGLWQKAKKLQRGI